MKFKLSKEDLAYIAGYVDGEGQISIPKVKPTAPSMRKRRSPLYFIIVKVVNTCPDTLRWLQRTFGGAFMCPPSNRLNRKPVWVWQISSIRAYHFLKLIQRYLKQKSKHAAIAIAFWENKKDDRQFKGYRYGVTSLSTEEITKRENYYKKMKELNRKGTQVEV